MSSGRKNTKCKVKTGNSNSINQYLLRSKELVSTENQLQTEVNTAKQKSNMAAPSEKEVNIEQSHEKQLAASQNTSDSQKDNVHDESVSNNELKEILLNVSERINGLEAKADTTKTVLQNLQDKVDSTKSTLQTKIDNMNTRMGNIERKFNAMDTNIQDNKVKLENIEKDLKGRATADSVKQLEEKMKDFTVQFEKAIEFEGKRIDTLEKSSLDPTDSKALLDKITELENALKYQEFRSRKYNLLIYGVVEKDNENVYDEVEGFLRNDCKIDNDRISQIKFANCHRLPKNPNRDTTYKPDAPKAIIVKLISMADRNTILSYAKNLPKGKTVRTDLPSILKTKRAKLAREAYKLRKEKNLQTAIKETPTDVWLVCRSKGDTEWTKV